MSVLPFRPSPLSHLPHSLPVLHCEPDMALILRQADWRPAAGWMLAEFPAFFLPNTSRPSIRANMEGTGAYADYRGAGVQTRSLLPLQLLFQRRCLSINGTDWNAPPQVDAGYTETLRRMAFGLNWDAVFPYPFHGMWFPYAKYFNDTWENCFIHPEYDKQLSPFNVSYAWISSYYQAMQRLGFHSCTYANWFEVHCFCQAATPAAHSRPAELLCLARIR
jgi:hypothetical protein